ncbi:MULTISPECIES: YqcC family protein [Vibrio]|uniref:YqcC family protein n=1 Tax=Vibrio TaxID=662 RepID=UPI00056DCF06|nr:YqcC family protein [Vibrio pacinii]
MLKQNQLIELLDQLQADMQALELWQQQPPSSLALQSEQPFAVDTLAPEQWLQWVFIGRMRNMIDAKQPLPSGFAIAPYFEQCWQQYPDYTPLLARLAVIDEVCA